MQPAKAISPACSFLSAALFTEGSVESGHKIHKLIRQLQPAPSCLLSKVPSRTAMDLLQISRKHKIYHISIKELYYMHNCFLWSGAKK